MRTMNRQRRGQALGALAAALGIVLAVVAYNNVIMPRFVRTGSIVRVPEVRRLAVPDAEKKLTSAGLAARVASRQHSAEIEAGKVIGQNPDAGERAKRGRQVSLIVSLGRGASRVPDVRGQTVRGADIRLRESGFSLGRTLHAPSTERSGSIVATSPPPEAEAEPGARIDALISDGRGAQPLVMPSVEGLPAAQVLEWFDSLNLAVTVRRSFEETGRPGLVVRQEPEAGRRLDTWSEIALYVSR